MHIFLGRVVKYFLWVCLFVLLGAFLFWLIKFKWSFVDYISYLNSIWVEKVIILESDEENIVDLESGIDEQILEEDVLENLDDGYFLPETSSDDSSFWFSGVLENDNTLEDQPTDPSISKEALVDLIKSREK